MTANQRIQTAIDNTKRVVPGYFEKTLDMRTTEQAGSYYPDLNPAALEALLRVGLVTEWPEAPDLAPGCTAFKLAIPGVLGALLLADLPADYPVVVADPKGTGEALCEVYVEGACDVGDNRRAAFTTLIVGDEQGSEVVFTFHPGAPLPHDQSIKHTGDPQPMTAGEAMALGLQTVKVISR